MDAEESYEPDGVDGHVHLKPGTGGSFSPAGALRPGNCCSPGLCADLPPVCIKADQCSFEHCADLAAVCMKRGAWSKVGQVFL
jgi:hypothetical protein